MLCRVQYHAPIVRQWPQFLCLNPDLSPLPVCPAVGPACDPASRGPIVQDLEPIEALLQFIPAGTIPLGPSFEVFLCG